MEKEHPNKARAKRTLNNFYLVDVFDASEDVFNGLES